MSLHRVQRGSTLSRSQQFLPALAETAADAQGNVSLEHFQSVSAYALNSAILARIAGMHYVKLSAIASFLAGAPAEHDSKLPRFESDSSGVLTAVAQTDTTNVRLIPVVWRRAIRAWMDAVVMLFEQSDPGIRGDMDDYLSLLQRLEMEFSISCPNGYMEYDVLFRQLVAEAGRANALGLIRIKPCWGGFVTSE